ncbi:MAG: ChbG/HpnK family deacetylase, partial [Candidatus Halalkalibacterium sp. M3_1C_030]
MGKNIFCRFFIVFGMLVIINMDLYGQVLNKPDDTQKYLMIRTDDIGMSHSVNTGLKKLLDTGYPVSVSVMFACPWYQEAV